MDDKNYKERLYRYEITKLAQELAFRGIPFTFRKCYDGYQIVVDYNGLEFDAICHGGSYGSDYGLLEIMGRCIVENEYDTVEGYLMATEIIKRVDNYLAK